ncbi:CynX/NimT family MFS transporter [Rhodoferax sp.]|uniref:MFS transporter n=1 Tax=Rhodoferax sp. TaxID=50421 RepID=UPI002720E4A4|nr:MFS transporter [Rhodoferax sp.]MDO9197372.1 MFS transporter [Rhodoferax sp.]
MTDALRERPGRIDPAFVVILAGVSAALHVGKLPPALPVLQEALGITLLQSGFLLSMVQLAGMTLGLAVGLTADGIGLRRSLMTGLLVLFGAGALGGWAQDATSLIALRALEGFGFLLVSMPAPSLVRQLVPAHRLSAMLGIWGGYMPLGTAAALLSGPLVIFATSWQVWWWGTAGLSLLMAAWVWCAVPSDNQRRPVPALDSRGTDREAWSQRLHQTLRSPGPWLVALSFAMYSGQWLAVIGFLPSIYAQAGVAGSASAVLTALAAAVNIVGNMASGRLLHRGVPAQHLLYTGFCVMALGAFLAFATLPFADGASLPPTIRFAAILLFSAVGGMIPGTLFSLAVRLAPGERTVSTTVGWMQQWAAFGQFTGPPLVAWVASGAGGWHWTWLVTGACSVLGVLLARQLGRQLEPGTAV